MTIAAAFGLSPLEAEETKGDSESSPSQVDATKFSGQLFSKSPFAAFSNAETQENAQKTLLDTTIS
jgi:hypothetical protein